MVLYQTTLPLLGTTPALVNRRHCFPDSKNLPGNVFYTFLLELQTILIETEYIN